MSDWNFLNKNRVKEGVRGVWSQYVSEDSDGFNGMFRFAMDTKFIRCIASDGEGWQHVSVSIESEPNKTPSWSIMCKVKDLFWDNEDVVVQFYPKKREYVNNHAGCLHLWRPTDVALPRPDSILVGYK